MLLYSAYTFFRCVYIVFLFIPFQHFNKLMNSSFKKCWREIKHTIYAEKNKQAKNPTNVWFKLSAHHTK